MWYNINVFNNNTENSFTNNSDFTEENLNIQIEEKKNSDFNSENTVREDYNASGIEFYQGAEAVRMRPGMYIGDVDSDRGLLNMINELIDNSVDEYTAGYGKEIIITLEKNGFIGVKDFGRGIPVDIHQKTGISAFELVLTQLHAGGKFNHSSYKVSAGLHGVGASVSIFLSSEAEAYTIRDGYKYILKFKEGKKVGEIIKTQTNEPNGTEIKFIPDNTIFSVTEMNYDALLKRLNEIAYLNKNLTFILKDEKYGNGEVKINHKGGIEDLLKKISKTPLHKAIAVDFKEDGVIVSIQMQWQDEMKEEIKAFTNNIHQEGGGTHVTGLRYAVGKILLKHYERLTPKNQQVNITTEDTRSGLTAILSLSLPDPKFSSQTKDVLSSKEARVFVEKAVSNALDDWINRNPSEIKKILMHITRCANMRINFQKKKELIDNKKHEFDSITHKFTNCQSNDPREKELIIVEGESAGGSAKAGRNPKFQATLSIQGKLLNVEKATMWKFLESKEFTTLINVLNCGIGQDINIDKINFHKIIIMTDADVDGSHIRTLLLTFFFKYLPQVILKGYVYCARPPLFRITNRSKTEYIQNNEQLKYYVYDNFVKDLNSNKSFSKQDYFTLLEYKKIIQEFFQDINHLFVSRLLMANILDIIDNKIDINEVIKNFHQTEKSLFNLSLKSINENKDLVIYLEYHSFYTKYTSDITFTNVFQEKIKNIIPIVQELFKEKIYIKHREVSNTFDEPLLMMNFFDDTMRSQSHLQRYKGLGEMDADELKETSLDPKNRIIEQVFFDEETLEETANIFQILMGEDVASRKAYIINNYNYKEEILDFDDNNIDDAFLNKEEIN